MLKHQILSIRGSALETLINKEDCAVAPEMIAWFENDSGRMVCRYIRIPPILL